MNRKIKFRGKSKKTRKWLYGYLGESKFSILDYVYTDKVIFDNVLSFNTDNSAYVVKDLSVEEDTICQFTGLYDKNGTDIYEGDIVLQQGYHGNKQPMVVKFECGAFIVGYHKGSSTKTTPMLLNSKCEVIGNLFDNSELLEDKK